MNGLTPMISIAETRLVNEAEGARVGGIKWPLDVGRCRRDETILFVAWWGEKLRKV